MHSPRQVSFCSILVFLFGDAPVLFVDKASFTVLSLVVICVASTEWVVVFAVTTKINLDDFHVFTLFQVFCQWQNTWNQVKTWPLL